MKKWPLFIVLIILLSQGGILLLFINAHQLLWKLKLEMNKISQVELNTFEFNKSYFESIRLDEKEFRLNDQIYDIKEIYIKECKVIVTAYKDVFEEKLLSIIDSILEENDNDNQSKIIIKFFNYAFIVPTILYKYLYKIFHSDLNFSLKDLIPLILTIRLSRPPSYN
jgi:hypothetical protein